MHELRINLMKISLESKDTSALRQIWENRNQIEVNMDTVEAVRRILADRGEEVRDAPMADD